MLAMFGVDFTNGSRKVSFKLGSPDHVYKLTGNRSFRLVYRGQCDFDLRCDLFKGQVILHCMFVAKK